MSERTKKTLLIMFTLLVICAAVWFQKNLEPGSYEEIRTPTKMIREKGRAGENMPVQTTGIK